MEEGINLKKKIQLCREENSNKKLIRYPEALKREILDFLKEERFLNFVKRQRSPLPRSITGRSLMFQQFLTRSPFLRLSL